MNYIWYGVISVVITLFFVFGPVAIIVLIGNKHEKLVSTFISWALFNTFSRFFKERKADDGETRFLFQDIDLTNEENVFHRVLTSLFCLLVSLIGVIGMMFCQLLLLEVSYSCDQNRDTKDCFDYKSWSLESAFSREPIDCNSAIYQNRTVEVKCYRIVFNFGLASCASYGAFQLCMTILSVAAGALIVMRPRTIQITQTAVTVSSFVVLVTLVALEFTNRSVDIAIGSQVLLVMATGCCFIFAIPWNDLIALKDRDNPGAYPRPRKSRRG